MAIDVLPSIEIIEVLENFMERKRPPENIRHKVDINYRIENQTVVIYELRPVWNQPEKLLESNIAKATFVKKHNAWKIYWMRSDLKWHTYKPRPTVKTISEFVQLVEEDKHHCFWG
jgi:putative salt-induced outer membrane protein YdiY